MTLATDERYAINIEYCGKYHKRPLEGLRQGQAYVVRFCGEWLGSNTVFAAAMAIATQHRLA